MDGFNEKVDYLIKLTEENNRILKKIRRDAVWKGVASVLWWLIVLIGPFVLYFYYVAPYIGAILEQYESMADAAGVTLNLKEFLPTTFGDLFKPIPLPK